MDMREQKFGIEIELTGLTRQKAAEVISKYLGNSYQYDGGYYEEYSVYDNQGRKWKVMYDSSIVAKKKDGTYAGDEYKVEFVSPICEYADIPTIQEIVRQLRHAGAIAGEKCGIHVHVNAAPHNAKTLRNITNIMYSKEDLIYKALQVDVNREHRYCKKVEEDFLQTLNRKKPKTLAEVSNIWYKGNDGRHRHYHDSRYHCLNLHSVFQKGTIEFRLFNSTTHAGKVKTYIQFCLAVSGQALNQTCAATRKTASTNEKYTFRTWLCKQKTAVFLVMPEEDNTKYFIISLILQQLYREILVVADENGGKLDNRVVFYWDEVGTIPKIESAEMMFSASRSRRVSIVPMIQSFAQLNKNYGKVGAEIIIDNCQDTIFGGFAPNSESAEVLSKSLGNKTVMSGSISRGKNDPSQSLQMIQRPLMTPDELKSLPKGNFIVSKTGSHPMRTKLKLFLKWGITFEEPYEIEEKSARRVAYADKQEIEEEIIRRYMCCVDEEQESAEQGTASRSGGMLQSQMNETVAKVRQALRTED